MPWNNKVLDVPSCITERSRLLLLVLKLKLANLTSVRIICIIPKSIRLIIIILPIITTWLYREVRCLR